MMSVDGYLQVNTCVGVCSNLHIWDLKRNGIIFIFSGDFFFMSWLFLLVQYFDVVINVHILVFSVHNV